MIVVENLSKIELIEGKRCKYTYKLIQSYIPTKVNEEIINVNSYGIEIERQDSVNDNVINIEREAIKHISVYRHKVHNLLKLLCDNLVSPVHMIDVIGEQVDQYVLDYNESKDIFLEELQQTSTR